jgi:hypothetical protein
MIDREISDLFYKRIDEVIKYFEEKLDLKWTDLPKDEVVIISYLRNCIIHNLGFADNRLSDVSKEYKQGEKIELNSSEVHSFGLKVRLLVRSLYEQAEKSHLKSS